MKKPVFIHSLFRSGSTYIFNAFRRSEENYWCYQEPLNEYLLTVKDEPTKLLEVHGDMAQKLRHPVLEKPYFYEFYPLAEKVSALFRKEFPYDQYFVTNQAELSAFKTYISVLVEGAQGRPVLQCCRSAGRVQACKSLCDATHVYLWRNPWDQWWSYKIDTSFDVSNLLISNSPNAPKYINSIREELGVPVVRHDDLFEERAFLQTQRLDARGSYMLFYALWCHAFLEARPYCDIEINIDSLTNVPDYRREVLICLADNQISGIDFDDCQVPQANFGKSDIKFFKEIEDEVHTLLLLHGGYVKSDIEIIEQQRKQHQVSLVPDVSNLQREAMRARELARRFESDLHNQLVGLQNKVAEVQQAEAKAQQAEAKAQQAEAKAQQAEAKAQQAEIWVQQAEARLEKNVACLLSTDNLLHELRKEYELACIKNSELNSSSHHWWVQSTQLRRELDALYNSRSWRMTKPFRFMLSMLRNKV